MPDRTVTPLRPRTASGYTDTLALNDIHALLTTQDPADVTLSDIAQIVTRTGRPMIAARDIEITITDTPTGRPMACAHSGDSSVFIRQASDGPGLLVEITARTATERDALTVTLDGGTLYPNHPGDPA
jgi:hypothetical protein